MSDFQASSAKVAALVSSINTAAKVFETADGHDFSIARRSLRKEAMRLAASLEEPRNAVWPRSFQINLCIAVEIATDLGLWKKFESRKTLSLAEIGESAGADEFLIIRILRHLVAAGILDDIPGPGYEITALGSPYLQPEYRDCNNFIFQDGMSTLLAIPRMLREHGYRATTREAGNPFKWIYKQEIYDWTTSHPERASVMVSSMKSFKVSGKAFAYPFDIELAKLDIKDDEVAIVDIGGAQGHVLEDIRTNNPNILGKFINQDLQSSLAAEAPAPGIDFMVHDFFMPQPIRKAHIYHLRHIMHNWTDEDCGKILRQLVPVFQENPASKLLLVDLVLPDTNVSMEECLKDLSMYTLGGMERSLKQWTAMLAPVGFKIKKIWRGEEMQACVECELA